METNPKNLADLSAVLRASRTARAKQPANAPAEISVEIARREIADFCRYIGSRLNNGHDKPYPVPSLPAGIKLSPRMKQTLDRLLLGDSEKQIAARLQVSPNTVHVYVKALYKSFNVSSRGELLARFVRAPLT